MLPLDPLTLPELLRASALLVSGGAVSAWLVSLPIRNASIVDILWGPAFVAVAWSGWVAGGGPSGAPLLLVFLVTLWGLRLGAHLARRNLGKGEDPRYAKWRREGGAFWPLRSLGTVFLLQGAILWTVSLPLQTAMVPGAGRSGPAIGWVAIAGGLTALAGILLEGIADRQLTRFRRDPANATRVLDSGVWGWSRHPNYFGDALTWWGFWLLGGASTGAWWTVVSPVLMTALLRWVSGVSLLERAMAARRPGYAEYVRRTSPFLPRPPRR